MFRDVMGRSVLLCALFFCPLFFCPGALLAGDCPVAGDSCFDGAGRFNIVSGTLAGLDGTEVLFEIRLVSTADSVPNDDNFSVFPASPGALLSLVTSQGDPFFTTPLVLLNKPDDANDRRVNFLAKQLVRTASKSESV